MIKEKDFYWIKLQEHFFEDDKIIYLMSQENGAKYVIFWVKLLLKCLKNKDSDNKEYGFLRFTDKIPYDDNLLSKVFNTDIDTVRVALEYFLQLDMIEILDDKTIYIEEVNKMIGKKESSTERVRRHRERKKLLSNETNVTKCNVSNESYKEVELEIEEEAEKDKPYDSIESMSFVCPYCFAQNIHKYLYPNEHITEIHCRKCNKQIYTKKMYTKQLGQFCKAMNKNYKYYTLAELLYIEHKKSDDKFLAGKDLVKTFLRWANDIRLLCETDERSRGLVENIIIWCQSHEGNNGFSWKNNILSGKKLREKFPVLYGQYMQEYKKIDSLNGYRKDAQALIVYLNQKTYINRELFPAFEMKDIPQYDHNNEDILRLPADILRSGKTVEYCKQAIDRVVSNWKFNPKMREYLRPSTIFKTVKIDEYHNMPLKRWETEDKGKTWNEKE